MNAVTGPVRPSMRTTVILVLALVLLSGGATSDWAWEPLAPGLDLARIPIPRGGEGREIVILRTEPDKWTLDILCRKDLELDRGLTAREWCVRYGLAAAINAGMYARDTVTHVGYLKAGDHVNNRRVNRYQSLAVFGPVDDDLPAFRIVDRDLPGFEWNDVVSNYTHVAQNLRLIKRPGENRWSKKTERRWREAALGEDGQGRVLMIFCRTPYTMYAFNEILLGLDIDLVAAQHLEGGSEAQLFLNLGDGYRGYAGYSDPRGAPYAAPAIPNVIGIRARE